MGDSEKPNMNLMNKVTLQLRVCSSLRILPQSSFGAFQTPHESSPLREGAVAVRRLREHARVAPTPSRKGSNATNTN